MEAECPKCGSGDFDVLDMDLDLLDVFGTFKCSCNKCGRMFLVEVILTIEDIK